MWDYSEKVMDYFRNPRNMGELEDANGIGKVGSMACGDVMYLYLKIDPKTEVIEKATFKTFGCASAIASASILTEMVIGKTIDEALKITNKDIVEALGGLPQAKFHCSVMGSEALEAAVNDYRGIKPEEKEELEGKLVCKCFAVTDKLIEKVVRENHLTTVEEVTAYTKAGGACGSCKEEIKEIIDRVNSHPCCLK